MASLLTEHQQWFDETTGTPINNGYIYIGILGLDPTVLANQKTLYSDSALTTPITNPQRTGSDGRALNKIYLASGGYSIEVQDSAGVQKYANLDNGENVVTTSTGTQEISAALDERWISGLETVADMIAATGLSIGDRVRTSGYTTSGDGGGNDYEIVAAATGTADGGSYIDLTGSSLQAKGLFLGGVVNVKQFGAVGDGVVDDTTAIQSAITLGGNANRKITSAKGNTYLVSSTVTGSNFVDWDFGGSTIDATTIAPGSTGNDAYVLVAEGVESSGFVVSNTVVVGSTSISSVDAGAGLVSGDLIKISSNEFYIDGGTVTLRGELLIVKNQAGTTVNLEGATYFSYAAGQNITLNKINPIKSPKIRNTRIKCNGDGSVISGIKISNAKQVLIEGCYIEGAEDSGIQTFNVIGGVIRDNEIKDCTSPAEGGSGVTWNSGYGTVLYECTRSVSVYNNNYINCRRAITGGGVYPTLFINTSRNSARGGANGFGNHEPNFEWTISENVVDGVGGIGITVRGQNTVVSKNKINNCGSVGIYIRNFKTLPSGISGSRILDNDLANIGGTGIWLEGDTSGGPINDTLIRGGFIDNATFQAILVNKANGLTISNVRIGTVDGAGYNIYLPGTSLNKNNNIKIIDCEISGVASKDSIRVEHCNNLSIIGLDQQVKPTESTIDLDTCNDVAISGCYALTNSADTAFINAVNLDDCNRVVINDNIIEGVTAITNIHGIQITNSAAGASLDHAIVNNIIANCDVAARTVTTGTNYSIITSNNGRSCINATPFTAVGANTVVANNL